MPEKKRPEKIKGAPPLGKITTDIVVANSRALEPFIKVFNYSGENIATDALGSLMGVFVVAERNEESAYIVNFLASVAKKEYFGNPRRGAIESFEAALHKINLALAELVKQGNVAWLGKLHGVIGVLEKNNLHFSATGEAKILLGRNGNFSEISLGLASEDASLHPIKTFVEVSSGRLMLHDKIIFTSPELFSLLTLGDLKKNVLRMDNERFTQFLRTALVNELDIAGTIIIDVIAHDPLPLPKKPALEPKEISNFFSQQAFVPPQTKNELPDRAEESQPGVSSSPEYIDSKTGHIYIQGDTPNKTSSHPHVERLKILLQDIGHGIGSFCAAQGKLARKYAKRCIIACSSGKEYGNFIARKGVRFLKRWTKIAYSALREKIASRFSKSEKRPSSYLPSPTDPSVSSSATQTPASAQLTPNPATVDENIPLFMKEKIATLYQQNLPLPTKPFPKNNRENTLVQGDHHLLQTLRKVSAALFTAYRYSCQQMKNYKKISLTGGVILLFLILGLYIVNRPKNTVISEPASEPLQSVPTTAFPLDTEKNASLFGEPLLLADKENIVSLVLLNNEIYLITPTSIFNVHEKNDSTIPADHGLIRLAAPMDDLRLVFLYTENRTLLAWSPINHAFITNILELPAGAQIEDIGAYLTYLYALDNTTNQLYRFPRAEGGFGQPLLWFKDSVEIETTAKMSVNETLFLTPDAHSIQIFSRGRFVKNLESPAVSLSVTDLFTHPGLVNFYALDHTNKRVLVWNQDGNLIAQYFSEKLADSTTITVNEKTNEALITTSNSLLSFKLGLEQ